MYEYGNLNTLNIEDVLPNRFQPRIHFDETKLNELAESIRKYGVIQPIVVRQIGDKYEIIAGERRYKASKIANKSTIPAIIINLNDKESEEIALLENVQRQNLTPIEEAVSYKRILDMGYITQVQLAEKLGKTQSTIANKVRLLNLDDQVQYALLNGKISERHARSLLRLNDRNKQIEMLNRIINERLTVKKTDEAIRDVLEKDKEVIIPEKETITEKEIKKPNFIKSEPVEELFGADEPINKPKKAVPRGSHEIIRVSLPKEIEENLMRKDEKGMDIDKIMREAQDINVPEENKDISELMKNDNNVFEMPTNPVEPIISEIEPSTESEIPLVNDDQNKFVNFSGIVQPEEKQKVETPSVPASDEASFDSIFNQLPSNLQPTNTETVTQSIPNSEQLDKPVENIVSEQPITSNEAPEVETLSETEGVSIAEAVKNAMNSQLPEESIVSPNVETINPEPVIQPVQENVSSIPQEQPMESVVEPIVMPRTDTIQPKTLINNESEGQQSPLYSELVQNQAPITPEAFNIPEQPLIEEVPAEPIQMVEPVTQTIQPTPESVVPAVPEPVMTNIPDSDILEAPTPDVMNSNVNNSSAIESTNNNFIEVIRLIRNCADQIERLGYKIDVDEIDLGNSYQANFKIDKQ